MLKLRQNLLKAAIRLLWTLLFAPFEFQNDTGQYVGIDVELIKAIAKQQGFKIKTENPGFDAASILSNPAKLTPLWQDVHYR